MKGFFALFVPQVISKKRSLSNMKEQLAKIRAEALASFQEAKAAADLASLRVRYLGKKGELTAVL